MSERLPMDRRDFVAACSLSLLAPLLASCASLATHAVPVEGGRKDTLPLPRGRDLARLTKGRLLVANGSIWITSADGSKVQLLTSQGGVDSAKDGLAWRQSPKDCAAKPAHDTGRRNPGRPFSRSSWPGLSGPPMNSNRCREAPWAGRASFPHWVRWGRAAARRTRRGASTSSRSRRRKWRPR